MWVSKREWENLKKRVEDLEYSPETKIPIYSDAPLLQRYDYPPVYVSVKEVVQAILNHLNLTLKYTRDIPAHVEVHTVKD